MKILYLQWLHFFHYKYKGIPLHALKMKLKFFLLPSILIGTLLFSSCKRNNDSPLWNIDMLAPLVQASLSMGNIVKDTGAININSDNSYTIVTRQELAKISLDSLVVLNAPPFNKIAKVNSLVLDTKTDTTKITIGQIAQALIDNGNSLGYAILFAATSGTPINLTGLPPLSFTNLPIDASNLFKDAEIATGTLTLKIANNLPVDIQTLQFDIKNKIDQATVIANTFSSITANGGSVTDTKDLAGKHIEGLMEVDIPVLQLGNGNVILNLSQSIDVILTISGVSVNSATAVFPDQDIVKYEEDVSLIGLSNGIELTYAEIESGYIKVEVISTAQDNVYFTYGIPGAFKTGVPFEVQTIVPAALPGAVSSVSFNYDLSGYSLDLTGQMNNKVNTFFNTLVGRIKYTGLDVSFSLSDSMIIRVSTVDLKPSYAKGYLGKDTIAVGPASVLLDIFKNIESGSLNFEKIKMNIVVDNGFGLDGSVKINTISATNTRSGVTKSLTGPTIGSLLTVAKATDKPYANTISNFDMSTGSNAADLINILPDKVNYDVQVITNPAGNTGAYSDFAYNNGVLNAFLDIEMPLSLIASQLVLSDTVAFNMAKLKTKNVNSGTFSVNVKNGFPLNAAMKMYFLNSSGTIIDSLKSSSGAILPAPVDAANVAIGKQSSILSFYVDEQQMDNFYNSTNIIFKIEFTTVPNNAYLKIYSTYAIDFTMIGAMDYSIHKKQ